MSQQASAPASALVGTGQRPAVMKLLRTAMATRHLRDLTRYIAAGGSCNAECYYLERTYTWFATTAEYLGGPAELKAAPLLTLFCCNTSHAQVVTLLDSGAEVDGRVGQTSPLFTAAANGDVSMMKLLLDRGAEVSRDNGEGPALLAACEQGHMAAIELLIARGADYLAFSRPVKGMWLTPMTSAACTGQIRVMAYLRGLGAPFEVTTGTERSSALHAAVGARAPVEGIKWLIDQGHNIHAEDTGGGTALHTAIGGAHPEAAVALLIAAGADVQCVTDSGFTALHVGAQKDNVPCLTKLLQAGADPFAVSAFGEEPLLLAARFNSVTAARFLSQSAAFKADARATTVVAGALLTAAKHGHPQCISAVLEAWATAAGPHLLHAAKDVATLDEILKHLPDVASSVIGFKMRETEYSVLHSAVAAQRPVQVICKLLKLGADPLAKDAAGQTPADLARADGQTLIAQLLDRAAQDKRAKS